MNYFVTGRCSRGSTTDEEVCLDMTDAEVANCLARGREGDEKAILQIFHYMYPHVAKLVQANLPVRESAEDLVQQVCIKVMTKLDQFSGKVPFLHWVSRIAVNTCIKALRAEKIRPELRWADLSEEEAGVLDWLATTDEDLRPDRNAASRELVEKLLAQLKPKDRLVISLMTLEGRTIEEVREITGWSQAVIKVRAFRARLRLRKLYNTLMREERT